MKKYALLWLSMLLTAFSFAQLQSPEQFLGYNLGSHYTPHWRIIDYFRQVAANAGTTVKLQEYGKTNEGRPLMVAFISSASNISNLENIRNNNLGLAKMGNEGVANNAPVIVWLSYNVHGNEASSSEAAMKTLYSLVDPSNSQAKQWLQNTVVVIDPCINPDGRDRYVNWYNSVVGVNPNSSLDAREHNEPWPGGRTNHYNFDLNRDWAWQTQIESQQRMQLYNQWLPQVHVDFHEQGVNNPYYFAPAAQPYHEVITNWQRDFQQIIGRAHAKYFDEKGWLYFTKEVFDLLYPSYGDTYPLYNGAIGMTYEQGGGPAGGLAALTDIGDTLTLLDRINHHYTTSLSTIETASQNGNKLVAEFQKFYADASNKGAGEYKSYIIKYTDRDEQRINALQELLTKNKIKFTTAKSGNYRGLNYDNGKEESFSAGDKDILITTTQPKGTLVKVLFEPNTLVVDSNTYDITAWSLPYVYGLKAYATKQTIVASSDVANNFTVNTADANPYGYVIPWNGISSVKLMGQLLQKGIKLRMSEEPFELGGKQFDRGAIIVLKTSNQYYPSLWNTVRELANNNKISLTSVSSGFVDKGYDFGSSKVHPLKARRVALLTGEGVGSNAAGEVWHYFDQLIGYPVTLINLNNFRRIRWSDYDVIIMPDGNYRFLADKGQADDFKNWIEDGGHVVAMEGAVSQLSKLDWAIKLKKADDEESKDVYASLRKYENRERDFIPNLTPGSIFRVELDNTHPLAFGYPNYYYTLKQDDNIYDFIKEDGWNVGVIKKEKQVAGFVGSKLKDRLQDGLLFGVQNIGNGTVTYLADDVLFRSFWENGKLMFGNAVFLVGQ
ncbi:MAG: M14 metallopeptidase family protein [Flavisolibacter sp.]